MAADGRQDRRDLWYAREPSDAGQARHYHRSHRARSSCLPRLLQARLPEAVRKVLDLPAQRVGLQQPRRFPPQEGIGPSRRDPPALPNHHGPLCCLPGTVAQCSCRLPAAPAPCPPGHRRRGPLSRHQDPRPPSHPPPRSPLAWRHSGWRLDRQTNPPHRPHHLPPLRQGLRPEPAALRSPQAQRPRPATARRLPLRLPPHAKRSPSSAALPLLPQTTVRTSRKQPLPSPPTLTSQRANSKPPTTAPTTPFNKSSICLPPDADRLFDSSGRLFDSSGLRFSLLDSHVLARPRQMPPLSPLAPA